MFVGLLELKGERKEKLGDPISMNTPPDAPWIVEFNSQRVEKFDPYVGRLVIDWGDGTRAWVQRAGNKNKAPPRTSERAHGSQVPRLHEVQVVPG